MFLQRMETIGFKSFAERIQIEFMPGITAIVGPNGSGKSNVIDAIRWVLGEQSARSLRGQKMEDIIFQGSDTRKRLNFAEVSLILNNERAHLPIDYQEVSITRRVYRSGESEFFINKQPCRLKDIVDLFTDTGLGRESFSIIGQGKIDEILRSKAEERRSVFEEAAGVMKYKQRKQQAMFKLEDTEENLSRIHDIMHEIKQQLDPLKEQATVAKQYQTLMKQLEKREIALLITEIDQLYEKWQSLLKTIEMEREDEIKQLTQIQLSESALVQEREKVRTIEEQLTELQQQLLETTEQLEQAEGKRTLLIEKIKHRQENKANIEKQRQHIANEIIEMNRSIQSEKEAQNKVVKMIQSIQENIDELKENLLHSAKSLDEEIENLKSDYIEWLNRQAVLQNEQITIEQQLEQNKGSITKHRTDHAEIIEKHEKFHELVQTTKQTMIKIKDQLEATESEMRQIEQALHIEKQTIDKIQNNIQQKQETFVKVTSRKDTLLEMKQNFQGFAFGVRQILQAKKRGILTQIDGAVIDLIDVPNDVMTAMDTILGHQAQHIVVPNEQVARETINWLKRENKGRATFLPLEVIAKRQIPSQQIEQIKRHKGFIGIGSELVHTAPRYKRVVEHLMGNVIVTKTLKDANEIATMTNRKYRIVTLDGDVVYPGGSMSGGAQKKQQFSLFSREKELQQLTAEIQTLTVQLQEEKMTLKQHFEHYEQMEKKRNILQREVDDLKGSLQEQLTKQKELHVTKQSIEDELSTYHYYIEQYETEKNELLEKQQSLHDHLIEVQAKISETEQSINEKTLEQKEFLQHEKLYQEQLHELEIKYTEQEERRKNSVEKLETLQARYDELKEEDTALLQQLEEIEADQQMNDRTIEIDEQIKQLSEQKEKQQVDIELLRSKREKMQQWISDEEIELRTKQKLHDQLAKTIQEKEIEANRLDVMLDNRLTKLQSEYVITYEKAKATYEKVSDVTTATKEVKQLKREIESLGTVNLGAIEEYDRLQERMTFLNEQKEDLIEAKQTLFDAIQKMDEEMIVRFKETFAKIHVAFTEVFKQLFGGGHAELIMTDPDDYLGTGIDIVARPPGKKLKTLELLSGGERALTAIALLFAILKARPVPFVILDEVDAALDEANVERFAAYLKSFSKESQFIVISHRKGTMEEADALYGVTMQESGVSRFVSVKLEEADQLMNVT